MSRRRAKIRTLAITGGTGFVGAHLLRLALAAGYDVRALTRVFLKGLLQDTMDGVTYVNAPQLAAARGIEVEEKKVPSSRDYANEIETLSTRNDNDHVRTRQVDGTIFNDKEPHIVSIQGLRVDVVPNGTLLIVPNHDRPGMVGAVGQF